MREFLADLNFFKLIKIFQIICDVRGKICNQLDIFYVWPLFPSLYISIICTRLSKPRVEQPTVKSDKAATRYYTVNDQTALTVVL